jgi:tetratricopeptide (TPR) repeat protein
VELDDLRHPDAERLAEYADGVLTDEARVEVEDHLGRCEDCRAVVLETTAFLESMPETHDVVLPFEKAPARPRRWWIGVAAGLAAAAILVLAVRVVRPGWPFGTANDRPELQDLIAAVASQPTRPVDGRLTGGFKYAPPPSPTRGPGNRDLPPDVRIAAARLEQAAAGNSPSANAQETVGVAFLVLGELDKAIGDLEHAVARQPSNARYQSDLAAAYLARAKRQGNPADWQQARAAAERATQVDPNLIEAWFNRALAIEGASSSPTDVSQAWHDYLARDSSSEWAREHQQR